MSVRAIVQDRLGFMWFGTQEGLNRFDGRSMVVYRHDANDPHSVPSNRIAALFVDSRGTLWVGTRGGGIARYDPALERFDAFLHDPADPWSLSQNDIAAIAEDRRGRLWVATHRGGLNRVDAPAAARLHFVRIAHDAGNPRSLSDDRTRAVLVARDGAIWVGTMSGINRLDGESFTHYRHDPKRPDSISDDEVWALLQDRKGTIWAGTWGGGLSRLDSEETGSFSNFRTNSADPFSVSDDRIMVLAEDREGTIWAGTQDQLNELVPAEQAQPRPRFIRHANELSRPRSLSGNYINAIFEDRAGDLWVGSSEGGVSRIDRRHTLFDRSSYGLGPSDTVTALLEDRRGTLWIGSSRGLDRVVRGADRFTPDRVTSFRRGDRSGFAGESVSAVLEDRAGTIWIATIGGGLLALYPSEAAGDSPRFFSHRRVEGDAGTLASDAVLSLLEDRQGTLWVGTYRGLHAARTPGSLPVRFVRYQHERGNPETLSADTIEAIAEDSDGMLWVGTYSGLNRLDPVTGRATRFVPNPLRKGSLSHEFVYDVHVDREGRIWAATWGGGLCRYEPQSQTFTKWGTREGLPSETVHEITEDGDGNLWIATPRGLSRLDASRGRMFTLTEARGLHFDHMSALAWDDSGAMLAGGRGGVTAFDPRMLTIDRTPPPVVLTAFRIGNERVRVGGDGVTLEHHHYLFSFDFAALTFSRSQDVRYAYKLEGLHDRWIEAASGERSAVFNSVPPGSYVFRVRAANADGVWNEEGASMPITILPPWWLTWWARSLALLLLIAVVVSWPLIRLKRQREISAMLETKVTERTAELAEANVRLEQASRTDPLTGLPNRRHFLQRADEQLALYRRYGRPFAIALADVDNFKSVNDRWGHDAGDIVLKSVSETFRRNIRESDMVARWGGEEFIILLPECDGDGATHVVEKVRAAVEQHAVPIGDTTLSISITVGVAIIAPDSTIDHLSSRADAALYQGKRSGKNRVVFA
jgi:diguanylate cyclase (GGDEF)-like protein